MSGKQAEATSGGRRAEVLALLRERSGPASINELAERMAVHPNTVRFHLEALTDAGQVERVPVPREGRGRPAFRFRAHAGMDPSGPRNYQLLAEILVADLAARPDPAERAVEAGLTWGSRLGRDLGGTGTEGLVNLLDGLGFQPEPRNDGQEVGLHHCPFLELATERSTVVCPLHLGLLRGAMTELDPAVAVEGLDAFVEPDLCLVRLSPA